MTWITQMVKVPQAVKMPFFIAVTALILSVSSGQALAAKPMVINDAAALKGLKASQQPAKGVFLIDFTNPQKTAFYLDIILGTHKGFVNQGVKPDLVLVFIGETVKYLTSKPDDLLEMESGEALESIRQSVEKFRKLGVRMEVCAVATKVFKVDNATLHPGMTVVSDGFISLIGWQSQGYHLVPIF